MATAMFAGAMGAAMDRQMYGPASVSSKDFPYDPNSRLDNIEKEGWSIKGSPSLGNLPEGAGNPGGPTVGMEEYSGKPYSGTRNTAIDFTNKSGNSTLTTHFGDHASEFGYTTEDEYLSGARIFLRNNRNHAFATLSSISGRVSEGHAKESK